MKKQSMHAISKKVFTVIIAAAISGVMAQSSYALPDKNSAKGFDISYTGRHDKGLAFNVNYKNELSEPFELIVKNDQDQVIYSEQYAAKAFNKSMIFSELPDNCKLTFSIVVGKKQVSTQTFEIKSQVKTVEEYIVKGI